MAWITPVFDRTENDVLAAQNQIAAWMEAIAAGQTVSTVDLKGCLNAADFNRIEGNTAYLAERLTALQYPVSVVTKTWQRESLPNRDDVVRIIGNVQKLLDAYYRYSGASDLPDSMLGYTEINSIEENLFFINSLLDWMMSAFKKCGTFKSGQKTFLPLRR